MIKSGSLNRNVKKGHRGFQRKLSLEQELELVQVWIQNAWKTKAAKRWLKEMYGIELNQPTLWYLKNRLKKNWEKADSEMDNPAKWNHFESMRKNGVPSEHGRELHRMWMEIEEILKKRGLAGLKPSYRSLHWWTYVIEYHGDIMEDAWDRMYVAEMYAVRHMAHDLFDIPMETEDLDQWLRYRPWEGGDKENRYLQAIAEEKIPKMGFSSLQNETPLILMSGTTEGQMEFFQRQQSSMLGTRYLMSETLRPYLLPSMVDFFSNLLSRTW